MSSIMIGMTRLSLVADVTNEPLVGLLQSFLSQRHILILASFGIFSVIPVRRQNFLLKNYRCLKHKTLEMSVMNIKSDWETDIMVG